jgi:predicted XRE-type DNA-binding protein
VLITTLLSNQMSKNESSPEFQMVLRLRQELLTAIEAAMEKDGISQGEIARRIGAQRYNVNKVMRRKLPVTVDFLLKMSESIGLDVEMKIRKPKA